MAVFSVGVTNHSQACIQNFDETVIAIVSVCHLYNFGLLWMNSVKLILDLGQYLIAGAFGVFMIFRIIFTLSNRLVTQQSAQLSVINTRNQVARMLIVNVVVFFSCYLPFKLLDIGFVIGDFTGYVLFPNAPILGWCGRLTMLLYASLNPILYNMFSSYYRQAYKKMLC